MIIMISSKIFESDKLLQFGHTVTYDVEMGYNPIPQSPQILLVD